MSDFIQMKRRNKLTLDKKLQKMKNRVGAIKHADKKNKRTVRFRNFTKEGQNKRERQPKQHYLSLKAVKGKSKISLLCSAKNLRGMMRTA